jgi:hypothetical protein
MVAMSNVLGKQHPITVKAVEYLEKFRGHNLGSCRSERKTGPHSPPCCQSEALIPQRDL